MKALAASARALAVVLRAVQPALGLALAVLAR